MTLTTPEYLLYRNLKSICAEPLVNDTLVKYAQMQYNIALNNLCTATDVREVGKWQQAVMIWEHFVNLKANVDKVLSNATAQPR